MKNLHLMPMQSTFDDSMVTILNQNFPAEENLFIVPAPRKALTGVSNCIVDPDAFTSEYINNHFTEYKHIFMHSLYLPPAELLRVSDEAAKRITWIVWGHDLYSVRKKEERSLKKSIHNTIHYFKKLLRGTFIKEWQHKKAVRRKVAQFERIGIGFPYDERMIRKKYGKKMPVVYGPVMSNSNMDLLKKMRKENEKLAHTLLGEHPVRILIGHSGFDFLEHEKYLRKLSAYKNDNIHIYMVLAYGASPEKIKYLSNLANQLFGREKVTVQTEMMSLSEYNAFLSTIDIAIFPFRHQSALGNTKRMAYMGTKLYFDPRGVLAKGFLEGGVETFDCRCIGKIPFSKFIESPSLPSLDAPLFFAFEKSRSVEAWKTLLS